VVASYRYGYGPANDGGAWTCHVGYKQNLATAEKHVILGLLTDSAIH